MYGHSVFMTEDVIRKYNEIDLQFCSFLLCKRYKCFFFVILQKKILYYLFSTFRSVG